MVDALPESARAELDDPFAQLTGPLASTTRLDFEVVDSARLTPHMQRLRLTAPQLDGFGYLPGHARERHRSPCYVVTTGGMRTRLPHIADLATAMASDRHTARLLFQRVNERSSLLGA